MKNLVHWTVGNIWIRKALKCLDCETRDRIAMDVMHGMEEPYAHKFLYEKLSTNLPFRSIFLWRLRNAWIHESNKYKRFYMKIIDEALHWIYKPLDTIEISVKSGDLGGGFYLPHRYCVINAYKIGAHVSVLQGVTIGKQNGVPVIGDHVVIYPNAVVAGNITIGDHAWVGAGAFVNYDVPECSTIRASISVCKRYENRYNVEDK